MGGLVACWRPWLQAAGLPKATPKACWPLHSLSLQGNFMRYARPSLLGASAMA